MARLHLAYRFYDRERALKLRAELEKKGHRASIHVDFLVAGHLWRRRIEEAFTLGDSLIVLLEYDFIEALNRKLGLLREKSFRYDGDDLAGKLVRRFKIRNEFDLDQESLDSGMKGWLFDCGVPPIEQF